MYGYSNPCPASGLPAPPPRKGVGGTRAEPLLNDMGEGTGGVSCVRNNFESIEELVVGKRKLECYQAP